MKRRRGYTLIEVLLAATMGAMMVVLAAQVFQTTINARARVIEVGTEIGALRRAYETIDRDMHSATVPPDDSGLQFGLSATAAGGGTDVLQFAAVVGEPLLAQRQVNETVLVQYSIQEDPRDGRPTLFRYETPYPIQEGGSAGQSPDTRQQPLLVGVTGAVYRFYDSTQQAWVDTWDGVTGLPTAIRLDLTFQPRPEDEPRLESWMFSLPAGKAAADDAAAEQAELEATQ